MPSAAQLRSQIQDALSRKAPYALTPAARPARAVSATGVKAVDELLQGGLPVGAISELTGPECSGRVSLALAFLAGQTSAGQVCAWVDASDGLDPASARATGVDLERLLWVRCGDNITKNKNGTLTGTRFPVGGVSESAKVSLGMHPRMESRGLSAAIEDLLGKRNEAKPGTPSALNYSMATTGSIAQSKKPVRAEQIASDRLPARRGDYALEQRSRFAAGQNDVVVAQTGNMLAQFAEGLARVAPRCAETQQGFARANQTRVMTDPSTLFKEKEKTGSNITRKTSWDKLDQAIRVTDLLLHGGGFSCVVMDMSAIEANFSNRIPLATWFRFKAAADRTRTSLLVLSQHACTGSTGEVLLQLHVGAPDGNKVMSHISFSLELVRQKTIGQSNLISIGAMRKPPRSTTAAWNAPCASLKAAGVAG